MVHFNEIRPSGHYLEEHAEEVPWDKVVEIILRTKSPRKKGDVFEIKKYGYYILFEVKNNVLNVINAKRSK